MPNLSTILLSAPLMALAIWAAPLAAGTPLPRQSYAIPVSVRVVLSEGESAAKLTESETFQNLWHITTGPLGKVTASYNGYRVPATLLTTEGKGMTMVVSVDGFLGLVGLGRMGEDAEDQGPSAMVEIPMWSYPAGVQFTASRKGTGYLSFYIVTGGELPAS